MISALKQHPELIYWYSSSIQDPGGQNLEQHTLRVMENFQNYFGGTQTYLENTQNYLILLALHDIGKPAAVVAKNKYLQHEKTLAILKKIEHILPVDQEQFKKIVALIDEDLIGHYMNPAFGVLLEDTAQKVIQLSADLGLAVSDFWPILVTYYQCDAAGYKFLRDNLFVFNGDDPEMNDDGSRLKFKGEQEAKFEELNGLIKTS